MFLLSNLYSKSAFYEIDLYEKQNIFVYLLFDRFIGCEK